MSNDRTLKGTIVKGIAGFYYVKSGETLYRCKARGIFKKRDMKPAVGDHAEIELIPGNDDNLITEIMPRKNVFIRPFVANVDCFAIVVAVTDPDPVTDVTDRFLVMSEHAGTDIVLCINKCDLATGEICDNGTKTIEMLQGIYSQIYPVVCLDSISGEGFDELRTLIQGKKTALAGPSGVGKSTILNRLIPSANAETGAISSKSGRGKHTTRHAELFAVGDANGTMIFDTPGFTSFDVPDMDPGELQHLYPEIEEALGACRYSDCTHTAEPGCGVVKALKAGKIHESRYKSYVSLLEEMTERSATW